MQAQQKKLSASKSALEARVYKGLADASVTFFVEEEQRNEHVFRACTENGDMELATTSGYSLLLRRFVLPVSALGGGRTQRPAEPQGLR